MARRGATRERMEAAAREAARRMIARGERPTYRLRATPGRGWVVMEAPWVPLDGPAAARTAIAAWLDCPADAFDLDRT